MSESKPKLKVLDLFSGILVGGFSLGLERTGGFSTVAFCEIEPFPRRVLARHWPGVPCYDDVRTLTGARLAADGIAVDVITGGFPCQDLSVAGKQRGMGEGTRSGLWSEIVRLIGELRPRYVIVENVAALLDGPSERRGGWFGRVLGDLAECGYDAEWENIPAAAVGHFHLRERAWFMAYPQQEQRLRPVFSGHDAAQRAWGNTAVRMQNGLRSQVGSAVPSVFERWVDQPRADGVANGVSDWPHRLAACGNAVVPQIPELIGRAILQAEGRA
jgi:DNA (cytosine-5)-methyltransferase 1